MLDSVEFTIPQGSEMYIAYQRTSYVFPVLEGIFTKVKLGSFYGRHITPLLGKWCKATIQDQYHRDLRNEYETIQKYLPSTCARILDIGCGVAGIDLFLSRHYGHTADVWLLDKDGVSDVYYGFEDVASFYNSLDVARQFLELNGVSASRIHTVNMLNEAFPGGAVFDLVISLISWGFHYPVSTYIDQVYKTLAPNGSLIIDVRADTSGEEELRKKFKSVSVIVEGQKHKRLLCKKNEA